MLESAVKWNTLAQFRCVTCNFFEFFCFFSCPAVCLSHVSLCIVVWVVKDSDRYRDRYPSKTARGIHVRRKSEGEPSQRVVVRVPRERVGCSVGSGNSWIGRALSSPESSGARLSTLELSVGLFSSLLCCFVQRATSVVPCSLLCLSSGSWILVLFLCGDCLCMCNMDPARRSISCISRTFYLCAPPRVSSAGRGLSGRRLHSTRTSQAFTRRETHEGYQQNRERCMEWNGMDRGAPDCALPSMCFVVFVVGPAERKSGTQAGHVTRNGLLAARQEAVNAAMKAERERERDAPQGH